MKGNLLQGTARGKMGDIVAKVVHGKQILAKYQPIVYNPDSPKQRDVRSTFSHIAKIIKENRHLLRLLSLNPRYMLPSGASMNIRNAVVPYGFRAAKIIASGGNKMPLATTNPTTIVDSYTGQIWGITLDPLGNYIDPLGGVNTISGDYFFGSDNLIPAGKLYVSQFAPTLNGIETKVDAHTNILALQDRTSALGLPKKMGLQTEIADCGEWNYIYNWKSQETITQCGEPIPYFGATEQSGLMAFLLDSQGGIIMAQSAVDLP